jgi:hypothetical protein
MITADNLLTIISPGKDAGFNGIYCRLVLEIKGATSSCLIFYVVSGHHLVACVHCLWFCKVARVLLDR